MLKKKSLGQHFLHSPHYLGAIADTARVVPGERVLEVGPGEGVLTAVLLARGAVVTAIEKDHRLIPVLKEKFAKEITDKKLFLHEGDILAPKDRPWEPSFKDGPWKYKVVANIPYYITGAMLEKFLSAQRQPISMTLLVQKEVAERIAGHPSTSLKVTDKESILSLSVKAYGTPHYVKTVPAGAFSPPPKVDSAILAIEHISRKNFVNAAHEKKFFALVHAGFAHKRKLLARNLEPILGKEYSQILKNVGISEQARAEDVELKYWVRLAQLAGGL